MWVMMRVRDSGMPDEEYWESLLDVAQTLHKFEVSRYHDVAEMGCGYGTFTVPLSRMIQGQVYAYDMDPNMVARTAQRTMGLSVHCELRDVVELGFGVQVDAVLLFNILHCENPIELLRLSADAADEILVTHWRNASTPRGPDLTIRPTPEQVSQWADEVGLSVAAQFDLAPWHYGMRLVKR
jgi:SAM-dependent methyltransferase